MTWEFDYIVHKVKFHTVEQSASRASGSTAAVCRPTYHLLISGASKNVLHKSLFRILAKERKRTVVWCITLRRNVSVHV